jgi:hypothetical protein
MTIHATLRYKRLLAFFAHQRSISVSRRKRREDTDKKGINLTDTINQSEGRKHVWQPR